MLMRAQGPSSTRDLDVADVERKFEGDYPGIDWCERGDSNPHGFPRQILSLVRLPISPLSHMILKDLTFSVFLVSALVSVCLRK